MKKTEVPAFSLQSDLDNLEKERQERLAQKNKSNLYAILMGIVFFAVIITGAIFKVPKYILLIFTAAFITLGVKGISAFYAQAMAKFTLYYKENFIKKLVKSLYPKSDYYAEEQGAAPVLAKALNIVSAPLRSSQDLIEGVAENGWKFSFSELHRVEKQDHAFANLLYEIKLPHRFSQKFYFTPHEALAVKNAFKKDILLHDSRGNKFEIKTDQPEFAKAVLTKEILDTFVRFKKNFSTKNHIEFSLVEDSFYIIVPTIRDYCNISIESPISQNTVNRLTKEIHSLYLPVLTLIPLLEKSIKNLNTNHLAETEKIETSNITKKEEHTPLKNPIIEDKNIDNNEL